MLSALGDPDSQALDGLDSAEIERQENSRYLLRGVLELLLEYRAFNPAVLSVSQHDLSVDDLVKQHFERRPELYRDVRRLVRAFYGRGGRAL